MDFNLTEILNIPEESLRIFRELLIVIAIGLVVGLEREYSKEQDEEVKKHFAGVRTFPLVSVIGYLAVYLSQALFGWIYPVMLGAVALFVIAAYYAIQRRNASGTTTEFALIAVFLLSGMVYLQHYLLAAFLTLLITALLALKVNIHQMVKDLSQRDILSILLFATISALILPILPNEDFGPYNVLNPFKIWFIVTIFISLNFAGYFLHKFIDSQNSIITTGILGGFISSTATAWYFSRLGGKSSEGGLTHVAAIIIASSIMLPRILVWLFFFSQPLLHALWLPVLLFGMGGLGMGVFYLRKAKSSEELEDRKIGNPVNLRDASLFGFIYVVILLLVGFAEANFGSSGVLLAAGISGITDVDAVTLSMTEYAKKSVSLEIAPLAILIAAFANTLLKFSLCLIFGNATMRRYASLAFGPLFIAGTVYIIIRLSMTNGL